MGSAPEHGERQAPRALGPDTDSGPTQRAPGRHRSAGPQHRERQAPHRECLARLAPTQRASAGPTSAGCDTQNGESRGSTQRARERWGLTQKAPARQRAPGPNIQSARAPTQRALAQGPTERPPGPDRESAVARHRQRESAGADTEENARGPTQRAVLGPDTDGGRAAGSVGAGHRDVGTESVRTPTQRGRERESAGTRYKNAWPDTEQRAFGARHRDAGTESVRTPTQRGPGPDTESERVPEPDTESARARHRLKQKLHKNYNSATTQPSHPCAHKCRLKHGLTF